MHFFMVALTTAFGQMARRRSLATPTVRTCGLCPRVRLHRPVERRVCSKRSLSSLGRRGLRHLCLLEHKLAVLGVDAHRVALLELALEQPERERVLDEAL
jgi:hypothetical protein